MQDPTLVPEANLQPNSQRQDQESAGQIENQWVKI